MKKSYIKPAVAFYSMNTEAVIALSPDRKTEITGANKSSFEMLSREEEEMFWDEEQGW